MLRYKYPSCRMSRNHSYRKFPNYLFWYKSRCYSTCLHSSRYRHYYKSVYVLGLVNRPHFAYLFLNPFWFDNRRYRSFELSTYKRCYPYNFVLPYKIQIVTYLA